MCNVLAAKFKTLFEEARTKRMDTDKIKSAVSDYLKWLLEQEELDAVEGGVKSNDDIGRDFGLCKALGAQARMKLAKNDLDSAGGLADDMIKIYKMPIAKGSSDYKRLCREILKMHVVWFDQAGKRATADNIEEYRELISARVSTAIPAKVEDQREVFKLNQLVTKYSEEKVKAGRWDDKTAKAE